jgi:hypothetical protein
MRITYCNDQQQSTIAVAMETGYNRNVEEFREKEYPMLKGKNCS